MSKITVGKIEHGIPAPNGNAHIDLGLEEMKPGDSRLIKGIGAQAVGMTASHWKRHNHPDWKFKARPEGDAVRLWRVK